MQQLVKESGNNFPARVSNKPEFTGKIPPQAKELEATVLGAIMLERDVFDVVSEVLKPEVFYLNAHKIIYQAIVNLAKKYEPTDMQMVIEELKLMKKLDEIGGPYAISRITDSVSSTANILQYSRILFEKFIKREIIKISGELFNLSFDDSTDSFELLDYAEKSLNDIGLKNITGGMVHISSIVRDAINKIEEYRQLGSSITGIPSGFDELDNATRGWQNGDMIVLAARPSVGKTALALNIAKTAAANRIRPVTVGVWSLEMKSIFLVLRMLSAGSGIQLKKLQIGNISEEEMNRLIKTTANELAGLPIYFDDHSKITLNSIKRKAKKLKKENNLGLIIIDYLQLMSGEEGKGNREQEVAKVSRGLKELAMELDVPVIALSQLSREMGSKNVTWESGPPISAIRESGAVEQDADLVMMLWGPSDEDLVKDPSLFFRRKIKIGKQRNGSLTTEELHFNDKTQLFQIIEESSIDNSGSKWTPVKDLPASKSFYETESDDDVPF